MAYAWIPDGYSLKQVRQLQDQAVSAKRRHDDVEALLANPNTPLVAGGAALLAALPILSKLFFDSLELENIVISDEKKEKVKQQFTTVLLTNPATGPLVLGKKGLELFEGFFEGVKEQDPRRTFGR